MKNKKIVLIGFIFILSVLTAACSNDRQRETNVTTDNGTIAADCDVNGELAMVSAPVVISQLNSVDCDKIIISLRTPIILRDDFHSLSNICESKLFPELYYSLDSNSLQELESLSSTGAGGNFQLPSGVGRLVESRSLRDNLILDETGFYIQPGVTYSPNRLLFKVQMPGFIADFNSQNVNFQANRIRDGSTVFYKWAKRIQKDNGGDPMRFSSETYSIRFQQPNSLTAGSDFTIVLPETFSVLLEGNIVDNFNTIQPETIQWKWIRQNFGPEISPIIVNEKNPITEVIFRDHGNHIFEFSARSRCGNTLKDTVIIIVNGQINPGAARKNRIESEESCSNGLGNEMFIKNTSNDSYKIQITFKQDLRSWLDERTPGAGTVINESFEIILSPNEKRYLGCSVTTGTGTNGSDRGYNTWRITSEEKVE